MHHDRVNNQKKKKVADNESAGGWHVPKTKLWNAFYSEHCVTVSHNDISYRDINMQLSYRGTDPVCLVKGLDFYRNTPITNIYHISLWVYKNLVHCYVIRCIFNVYLEQAGTTYYFCYSYLLKQISFSLFKYWVKFDKRERVRARLHHAC